MTKITSDLWSIYYPIDHINKQNSPFILLISIMIFLAFTKFKCNYHKTINVIAGTTFGIYLIHDHYLVRESFYSRIFDCFGHTNSDYLVFYVLLMATAIFITCMTIELLRKNIIEKMITNKFDDKIQTIHIKFDNWLDNLIRNKDNCKQ